MKAFFALQALKNPYWLADNFIHKICWNSSKIRLRILKSVTVWKYLSFNYFKGPAGFVFLFTSVRGS